MVNDTRKRLNGDAEEGSCFGSRFHLSELPVLSHAAISLIVFANASPGTSLCLSYPLVATPWVFPRDFDIVLQGGLATVFFLKLP